MGKIVWDIPYLNFINYRAIDIYNIVSNVIISISAVFKIMKLVAFLLVCLGLAECTTLRRPGNKALKDVFVQR